MITCDITAGILGGAAVGLTVIAIVSLITRGWQHWSRGRRHAWLPELRRVSRRR